MWQRGGGLWDLPRGSLHCVAAPLRLDGAVVVVVVMRSTQVSQVTQVTGLSWNNARDLQRSKDNGLGRREEGFMRAKTRPPSKEH